VNPLLAGVPMFAIQLFPCPAPPPRRGRVHGKRRDRKLPLAIPRVGTRPGERGAAVSLELVPVSIGDARAYVLQIHRHHPPPVSGLFAVGVASEGAVCGVAIVGRPVARMAQDGWTAEVTRLATDGTKNACSILYAACWRAARALGWKRLITYTLPEEGGVSLRAAGWRCVGEAGGGSWSRARRPRVDRAPTQTKLRWEVAA
jgi:hypothetical protein